MELSITTALVIGLLGSTHCLGMCGGIVASLDAGLHQDGGRRSVAHYAYHLAYNLGRITSYTIAGMVAGLIGAHAAKLAMTVMLPVGGVVAGLFLIALGLYLSGWQAGLAMVERAGSYLWVRIEPLGRRFLPVKSPVQAFGLGLVWGWLPCGLVYTALALALMSGSPAGGAMLMLAFGLGTLPMLLAIGKMADLVNRLARNVTLRRVAGAAIIVFGAYTVAAAVSGHHHGGHGHMAAAATHGTVH